MKKTRYFSLFTGIGGFELGIGRGGECVGYSEIDPHADAIYKSHFPTHHNYGDITKINPKDLPDFDLIVGGFPCQAFSIAGKRRGFEDTRGTLFFEIARILKAKQPRLLLLENVKGLLSHGDGRTFKTIIATLDELGYDLQWQVLNSKNHGVPQNRERVIIVGHLRGTPRPKVFPLEGNCKSDIVLPTLTARYYGAQANGGYIGSKSQEIKQVNNPKHSNDRVYETDGISPTLNTMQGGNRQPFIVAERGRYKGDGSIEQRFEKRDDGLSNSLTTVEKDNRVFIPEATKDMKIRRLTPVECERLQGFPDGWTAMASDTQRYKTLGNAVTVNVIRDVVARMLPLPHSTKHSPTAKIPSRGEVKPERGGVR